MRCNKLLQKEGSPYPRTCAICGLGPCIAMIPGPDAIFDRTPMRFEDVELLLLRALENAPTEPTPTARPTANEIRTALYVLRHVFKQESAT